MSIRKSKEHDGPKAGNVFGENIKCTLVGDERVGKTSMLLSYQTDTYPSEYVQTILDTYSKTVTYNGKLINLQLYDIGGKQDLKSFKGQGRVGADVFLLCFAIDDRESFTRATGEWLTQVQNYWMSTVSSDYHSKTLSNVRDTKGDLFKPITILVGCKSDVNVLCDIWKHRPSIRDDPRMDSESKSVVTSKEAIEQAKRIGACLYTECCARNGTGIKETFKKAIQEVLQRRQYLSSDRTASCINSLNCFPRGIEDSKSDIKALLETTKANDYRNLKLKPRDYDTRICKILREEENAINEIDPSFFVECFLTGLNETVLHIMENHEAKTREFFSKYGSLNPLRNSGNPLVHTAFCASEEVILKVLKVCEWQIATSIERINSMGENLLHILIREGYADALRYVIDNSNKEKIAKLCFGLDNKEMYPLLSALSKNSIKDDSLLIELWRIMEQSNNEELSAMIGKIDGRKNNIFHLCATFKRDTLLREITNLIGPDENPLIKEILRALFEPNPDGKLPLHLCNNESLILSILEKIQKHQIKLRIDLSRDFFEVKTKKDNTCLNLFAKKNFMSVIDWIMNFMQDDKLKKLLMEKNKQGNNPPMVCVVYNRNDILKKFLMFIFSNKNIEQSEIKEFLHHRNVYDETILSLVLQHESTLQLPQMLLLDKEKEIHISNTKEESMKNLTTCLNEYNLRSAEVAITMKRAEDSYKKETVWETFLAVLSVLAFTLIVPLTVQSLDMSFDVLVVVGNWMKFTNEEDEEIDSNTTFRFQNSCQYNVSDELLHIPEKLDYLPRFCYSFSFIIIPWFFYFIEFLISRYFKETEKKFSDIQRHVQPGTLKSNDCKFFKIFIVKLVRWFLFFTQTFLHIMLWPLIMIFKRGFSELRFVLAYGKDKFDMQMRRQDHILSSSRARIIEVCIESSFQPLLQLYLLLPTLIHYVDCGAVQEILTNPPHETFSQMDNLQFWSIFTSVFCLSISFTHYKVTQKAGALDYSANPIGRIFLFLSILLQISCRLLAFVLLAYGFGPGEFWPMITILLMHIFLMATLHFLTFKDVEVNNTKICLHRKLHHCLLNGIGNIYIHNCITYMDEKDVKERMKMKHKERNDQVDGGKQNKKKTFWRQVIFNAIFVAENTAIILFVFLKLPNTVPISLLAFVAIGHLLGLMFNTIYYQFFHLWKDVLYKHVRLSTTNSETSKRTTLDWKNDQTLFCPALNLCRT